LQGIFWKFYTNKPDRYPDHFFVQKRLANVTTTEYNAEKREKLWNSKDVSERRKNENHQRF
jgi:hypothetical protein